MSYLASSPMEDVVRNCLQGTCRDYIRRDLPARRIASVAALLAWHGRWTGDESLGQDICQRFFREQHEDGGWTDCEDTAWYLMALKRLGMEESPQYRAGMAWLIRQRSCGGWGYSDRDRPNIPITAQVRLALDREDEASSLWLRTVWGKDLTAPYILSYKASWYLLARADDLQDRELAQHTIRHLLEDQRNDGSWGPWQVHPAGPDCFSTGIAMLALASEPTTDIGRLEESFFRAERWMERNILPNGFFPTHYLEFGTAWLLAGYRACRMRIHLGGVSQEL